jgi:protein ImuB
LINSCKWDEMASRFISIWFRHLRTDWFSLREPALKLVPFVLRAPDHCRMMVVACNEHALTQGIIPGMVLADAKACNSNLEVRDDIADLAPRLLKRLAEWCIRFSPVVAVDLPDGLVIDATGCAHLWGDEMKYLSQIILKLEQRGYVVSAAIADTVGVAWGQARFGSTAIVPTGEHRAHLAELPPESLRLELSILVRLQKLGLRKVKQFFQMPRPALRRRFGTNFLMRLDQALGNQVEIVDPVIPLLPYRERLPCLEPMVTALAIEIALKELLEKICLRLQREGKGIRHCVLHCYRVDGKVVSVHIGTHRSTYQVTHLYKLFEPKLATIEPGWGIELFSLDATRVEPCDDLQASIWESQTERLSVLAALVDRIVNRAGEVVHRYVPAEHHWPERSLREAQSLEESSESVWRRSHLRPVYLLRTPERIEVSAPIPDYPPMLFRYRNVVHQVVKADGPERIEQEWWIVQGQHRDYYRVEDEAGNRYWLFRLGHYDDKTFQWFLHGYFA